VLKIPNAALRVRIAGVEPAAAPASKPASATGDARGWSWISQAVAQPAQTSAPAAQRERLVAELALNKEQQARLDAITAELRPQFAALRDLPEDQRGAARQKVTAEMRARIDAMLTAAQKAKYAALQAESGSRTVTRGRIYLLIDEKPRAVNVRLGITDGTSTELIVAADSPEAADLKEGALVIVGTAAAGSAAQPRPATGPRMAF
jgi:HlyD family secretion protein